MVVIERKLDDSLVELGRVILALGAPTKDKHGSYLRSEHIQTAFKEVVQDRDDFHESTVYASREERAKDGRSLVKDFSTTDRYTDPAPCEA